MSKLETKRQQEICASLDQVAALFVTDSEGILQTANSKVCSLFGCDEHSVHGADVRTFIGAEYVLETIAPVTKREVQFFSKSGFVFWLEVNVFSITLDDNKAGYLWLGFDVTERKVTEQYLADSQLLSKTLMQTAPIGIFSTNSSGGCNYVNGCWAQQAGINGSMAKGQGWTHSLHPEDKEAVVRDWESLIENNTPFGARQYRYLHPDGKEIWIHSSAVSLYDTNRAIAGYLRIEQDITTRLQSEKIIRNQHLSMAASSKMSALGEMAGGVAHEINTPLAIIKNTSGQLQEVLDDDPLDRHLVKEMAASIEKTTDRIAKIVSGLRSFSRDGSEDPYQRVNIQQLIDETLSFCSERFKNNGITLTIDNAKSDLAFEGRYTEVSQVLLNILNNAHDAILPLNKKWIRISVFENPDSIEIQVTDSGNGISPEIQKKIFQPFFTTKEIGKGTGMGLSISSGIIQAHGGELRLDTNCRNTRFSIALPKKQM